MDIALLTTFLAPFLPFLGKLGEKAAEAAAEQLGVDSWEKAKGIWSKLGPKIEAKEEAKVAVQQVVAKPESAARQAVLQEELETLLNENPDLAAAIAKIMESDSSASSTATNIDLQGQNTQTAGDNAKQIGQIGQAKDITL
ncbi:MAG TPA: hypothetical protein DCE56_08490 [Cyanobacteria bacterium UBA8553]|nr:hypothetical protein [Cyanobacteria bacterium UBA8553]